MAGAWRTHICKPQVAQPPPGAIATEHDEEGLGEGNHGVSIARRRKKTQTSTDARGGVLPARRVEVQSSNGYARGVRRLREPANHEQALPYKRPGVTVAR